MPNKCQIQFQLLQPIVKDVFIYYVTGTTQQVRLALSSKVCEPLTVCVMSELQYSLMYIEFSLLFGCTIQALRTKTLNNVKTL